MFLYISKKIANYMPKNALSHHDLMALFLDCKNNKKNEKHVFFDLMFRFFPLFFEFSFLMLFRIRTIYL